MADFDSSLPIRSEADGTDERVQTKIVDATNPDTQQMEVDTDNNAHVEVHGDNPAGNDETLRLSELGHPNTDGIYDGTNNTDPSNSALIGHSRNASAADTQSTERLTSIEDSGGTVRALDISLHDEAGEAYSSTNPMPVAIEENEGAEIHDFDEGVDIASDAVDNHDYSVANGVTLLLYGVRASASGKMKVELQIGDGAASEVFTTKDIEFNSTSNPSAAIDLFRVPIKVTGTVNTTTVRLIRTNLDNQSQSLYSKIIGAEQ
jgi:hypothetical protein